MEKYIQEKVEEFAQGVLPGLGLELVEVQFRREGHGWVLRLYIDCESGVTVDHCAEVSRELSAYLDVEDLIEHAYHLEISSPGAERPLRSVADFQRFVGKRVRVKLFEPVAGQKVFIGVIAAAGDGDITLASDEHGTVTFSYDQVAKARLTIE